MFSRWISPWTEHGTKLFRVVELRFSDDLAKVLRAETEEVTIIVDRNNPDFRREDVEQYFESGCDHKFRFRRGVVDPDPFGATLMEATVGKVTLDLDVYWPGRKATPGFSS